MIVARSRSPIIELACIAGLLAVATLAPLSVLAAAFS
jgi:hypothetical protein